MYCYMQYMTDRFFGMRTDADTLKIYELKHLPPRIAAMADKCIDKFVKSDLKSEYPGLEKSRYSFTEEKRIPTSVLSEGVFPIAVLRRRREVRCRDADTDIVRQSRSRDAVVYRGKRVCRICGRRRAASFQTSGVLLRGGVETPGLRPGAYGKPAIDARLRIRYLAAASP